MFGRISGSWDNSNTSANNNAGGTQWEILLGTFYVEKMEKMNKITLTNWQVEEILYINWHQK